MKKLLLALLLLSSAAFAEIPEYNSLTEFVQTEAQLQNDYVTNNEDAPAQINDGFYWNLIRFRTRATIGLEVPLFASFSIRPFIELRWKRKTPAGYTDYAVK